MSNSMRTPRTTKISTTRYYLLSQVRDEIKPETSKMPDPPADAAKPQISEESRPESAEKPHLNSSSANEKKKKTRTKSKDMPSSNSNSNQKSNTHQRQTTSGRKPKS